MPHMLTPAQVNASMGWTPAKLKQYWDARARMCQGMADEDICLAQVARHVPVTLGQLAYDVRLARPKALGQLAVYKPLPPGQGPLGQLAWYKTLPPGKGPLGLGSWMTPAQSTKYWDARAQACRGMADEDICLAQVARHVPVTLGQLAYDVRLSRSGKVVGMGNYSGLGQGTITGTDVTNIATLAAQLISNPDATLARVGPGLVHSLDVHIITPAMAAVWRSATPYLLKYLGPPMLVLYALSGMAMWSSLQVLREIRGKKVTANTARRRRARRRR